MPLFTYTCPRCGWTSRGWGSEELAAKRGQQHQEEHETLEPMPELAEFSTVLEED